MDTHRLSATTCCYAVQDKVWVDDPDQVPWEVYTVLADVEDESSVTRLSDDCQAEAVAGGASSVPHCC